MTNKKSLRPSKVKVKSLDSSGEPFMTESKMLVVLSEMANALKECVMTCRAEIAECKAQVPIFSMTTGDDEGYSELEARITDNITTAVAEVMNTALEAYRDEMNQRIYELAKSIWTSEAGMDPTMLLKLFKEAAKAMPATVVNVPKMSSAEKQIIRQGDRSIVREEYRYQEDEPNTSEPKTNQEEGEKNES